MSPCNIYAVGMMAEAGHSHLPGNVAIEVKQMLRKHDVMCTGLALGTIGSTDYRIDVVPGVRPRLS